MHRGCPRDAQRMRQGCSKHEGILTRSGHKARRIETALRPFTSLDEVIVRRRSWLKSNVTLRPHFFSWVVHSVDAAVSAPRGCVHGRGLFQPPKGCSCQLRRRNLAQRPSTYSTLCGRTIRGRASRTGDRRVERTSETTYAVQRELPPVSMDRGGRRMVSEIWKSAGRLSDTVYWREFDTASPPSPRWSVGPWMHGLRPRTYVGSSIIGELFEVGSL